VSAVWYRDIQPLQEPFDEGALDDAGRVVCTFNVLVTKRGSADVIGEIVSVLQTAGVGLLYRELFTPGTPVPCGDGPYLVLRLTGGSGPLGTHNDGVGAYRRPSLKVTALAKTWAAAETLAQAAYTALIAVRNREVTA
jgi:hypothetical protein